MGRAVWAVCLAIGLGACSGGAGSDDSGPPPADDAAGTDAPLSCYELADRWWDELTGLRDCETATDCAVVGTEPVCDNWSIDCGSVANAAAYAGSPAEAIEAELFARGCDSRVSDCPLVTAVDCVDGRCAVAEEQCCFCPPSKQGLVVVGDLHAPGFPELGSGAFVNVQFVDQFSATQIYNDLAPPPGGGCVVYRVDAPATSPFDEYDGGTVTVADTLSPMPACSFDSASMRYQCRATSGSAEAGDSLEVLGGGLVEATIAGAAFEPTHVGMHLELGGADDAAADGRFPIVEYVSPTIVRIALSPLTADTGWSAAGSYAVIGGVGPTPASVDFLDDAAGQIAIDKTAGAESDSFAVTLVAGGSGFALDDASTSVDALPTDASAAVFSCDGAGGSCAAGSPIVMMVEGRTTNAPVDGLPGYAMPPATTGSIAVWRCGAFGASVEISEGAMAAILGTDPTRLETRVLNANLQLSGGTTEWGLVAGHGLIGYTTVAP